jgi:hypothetical protein
MMKVQAELMHISNSLPPATAKLSQHSSSRRNLLQYY